MWSLSFTKEAFDTSEKKGILDKNSARSIDTILDIILCIVRLKIKIITEVLNNGILKEACFEDIYLN